MSQDIGILQERSLHASIKELFMSGGARTEVEVDGYVIDVVKDGLLIEVQTKNFSKIKSKLLSLIKKHPVRLVYPIASEKWIVRQSPDGTEELSRRRSPKQMGFADVFEELVRFPRIVAYDNFSLEVLLIKEEEIRRQDGKGSWRRRGWSIVDRRLIEVVEKRLYERPTDFLHFIPDALEKPFRNSDLAEALGISVRIAQRMTYCLRKMSVLRVVGKQGNAMLLDTD
ncbi:MAG: hypothetical protein ACFFEE_12680 [Candidatus Thorarchaeota archaeon]